MQTATHCADRNFKDLCCFFVAGPLHVAKDNHLSKPFVDLIESVSELLPQLFLVESRRHIGIWCHWFARLSGRAAGMCAGCA